MKVDPRVEKNSRSVIALKDFLREIIKEPAAYSNDDGLLKALKSQGSLSKLNVLERGISATSLNTIKRISTNVLDGGFENLDRLRVAALDAINRDKAKTLRSNKVTKTGLCKRVKELESELQQALQDSWHLTMIVNSAMAQGRHYAKEAENPAVFGRCEREQRELCAMLSLRKHPIIVRGVEVNNEGK